MFIISIFCDAKVHYRHIEGHVEYNVLSFDNVSDVGVHCGYARGNGEIGEGYIMFPVDNIVKEAGCLLLALVH